MKKIILFALLPLFMFTACSKDDDDAPSRRDDISKGNMKLEVINKGNGTLIQDGVSRHTNQAGESYLITDLQYYISNVKFRNTTTDTTVAIPDSYYLVDERRGLRSFYLNVSPGTYHEIEFSIGVDSIANSHGDHSGYLGSNYGMQWNWDTGFKFLVAEGRYNLENASPGYFQYHIGRNAAYKTMKFTLPQPLTIKKHTLYTTQVTFELNEMFKSMAFSDTPSTDHEGGPLVTQLANNYANGGFSVQVSGK